MGRYEIVREKMTPKLGAGSGMSQAYSFAKKSYQKVWNSFQEKENQRSLTETKATLNPS